MHRLRMSQDDGINSRESKLSRFRKSRSKVVPPTPNNEEEVHEIVGNLKKHNKRYKNELDALEEAYQEKCQENFFLSQQLALYRRRFGPLEEIEEMNVALTEECSSDDEIPQKQEEPEQSTTDEEAGEGDIQIDIHKESPLAPLLAEEFSLARSSNCIPNIPPHLQETPSLVVSSPALAIPATDYAYLPLDTLTKSQKKRHSLMVAQQKQLGHQWEDKKSSKIFKKSKSLFTVHNRTGEDIYISVYDKRRVGVAKHVRISPVYYIEKGRERLSFEKPFCRSSRTKWLLFCRDSVHFDDSALTMTPSIFRNLPSYGIDFSDEVYIYKNAEGGLKASSRLNWKTRKQRNSLKRKSSGMISRKSQSAGSSGLARELQLSSVRKTVSLPPEEIAFIEQRAKITENALSLFLEMDLKNRYIPRIAICGSGGGCRAMVSTIGSLIAAELSGLLDCCMYVAGVSGSTWAIGLWESLALTPSQLRENIITKFEANLISRPSKKGTSELLRTMKTNWNTKQKGLISLIDIYGAQLSTGLLYDTNPKNLQFKLHHQIPRVINGAYPLPIYTAVQKSTQGTHNWFEFTPFEVGCTDFQAFVPSWGFGRSYNLTGESTDFTPAPPLGTLLATFGSAFCAPLSRMAEEFFDKLEIEMGSDSTDDESGPSSPTVQKKDSNFKTTILEHRPQWNSLMQKMSLGNSKIAAPAQFHNFAYDPSKEASKQRKPILELCDAGIDGNLPFPPLLRPEREIDIIIACNASKSPNIERSRALRAAAAWAEGHGCKFPPIDFDHTYDNVCSVFRDENDPTCPVVIYLPLKKNNEYSEFDPQENQRTGGYCSTFNFSMTREQVEELSGLTQFNMLQSIPIIKQAIIDVIESHGHYSTSEDENADSEEQDDIPIS